MHFRPRVCVDCLRVSFGWIACKWLFCLCKIAWKNMMEFGRGGACVPARVAPQGRIHRSPPRTMRAFLIWKRRYADVRAGTHAPPLRFRLGGLHMGWLMPFGQITRGTVDVVWMDCV